MAATSMPPVTVDRPPTEEEARRLRTSPAKLFGWWTGLGSGIAIFVLTVLLVLLGSSVIPAPAIAPAAVAVGTGVFVAWYVYVQRRHRLAQRRSEAAMAREAGAGHVKSTTYTIRDAVAVEESEDEGLSFYLLLDDGRTLFLSGQYLYEPVEAGFPWTSFELVRSPVAGYVVRLVSHGPSLRPSRTRPPFIDAEYKSRVVPDDGDVATRDFDALGRAG